MIIPTIHTPPRSARRFLRAGATLALVYNPDLRVAEEECKTLRDLREAWLEWSADRLRLEQAERIVASLDSVVETTGKLAEAGKEGHLIIKLPYKDDGASVVRAWIGTADRTLSSVGKGEYAPSHDDYDIHAIAPSPLPADVKWRVEIEKPDGTKLVGSIAPKM